MKTIRYLIGIIGIATLVAACGLEGIDRPAPGSTPSATTGKLLFAQKGCVGCHNSNAQGGLSLEAPDLRGTTLSYLAVLKQARAPKGQMARFSPERASDEEIASIYTWLKTFPLQTPTPDPNMPSVFPTPMPELTKITQAAPSNTPAPTDTPAPTAKPGEPTFTPAPTKTATPVPPPAPPKVDIARLIAAQEKADDLKVAADYAKDATNNVAELRNYTGQGLAAAQALQSELNGIKSAYAGSQTFADLQTHLDAYLKAAQSAAQTNDFAAGKAQAGQMTIEGRIFVLPLVQQLIVDSGRVGVVRGRVTNQQGQGLANAAVTIAYGRYKRGVVTDANGLFTAANIPAVKPIEVKGYASGYFYTEQNIGLNPGQTATVNIVLPRLSSGPVITVSDFSAKAAAGGTLLHMKATHSEKNLAEDQIFALNPTLGIAVVLLPKGNDIYEETIPFAPSGRWYFFAVDHKCFASNIMPFDAP